MSVSFMVQVGVCLVLFTLMPNAVLVFVIQTNNDDTLSRQHCFLQEYVTQSNSDIAGLYRKLLGAAPEIFTRVVE